MFFSNAKNLAMRDSASAALMGAGPFKAGRDSDFGMEHDDGFGDDDFGDDDGSFDDGVDFGYDEPDFSSDFGASARPTKAAAMRAWQMERRRRRGTLRRKQMLRPNDGSSIKVERYSFTISQTITFGTLVALSISGNPDTEMRPQRVTMNAPTTFFATVTNLQVANVLVTVGPGIEDAFNYSPLGQGMSLDMPTLTPSNRASMLGSYTGFVPPGFTGGTVGTFSVSFKGPSSVVA